MDIATLRTFFLWCTIINAGIGILAFLGFVFAGDFIFRIHSRWFKMSKEAFTASFYCMIGAMKIIIIMLNLVPYIVLVIIG